MIFGSLKLWVIWASSFRTIVTWSLIVLGFSFSSCWTVYISVPILTTSALPFFGLVGLKLSKFGDYWSILCFSLSRRICATEISGWFYFYLFFGFWTYYCLSSSSLWWSFSECFYMETRLLSDTVGVTIMFFSVSLSLKHPVPLVIVWLSKSAFRFFYFLPVRRSLLLLLLSARVTLYGVVGVWGFWSSPN